MNLSFREIVVGGLAVGCIAVLGFQLFDARSTITDLKKQINDPITGYEARLGTCHANTVSLQATLDKQNATLVTLETDSATRIAASAREVAAAQSAARAAQVKFDRIMSAPPQGTTLLDRYEDIDHRLLETLQ